MSLHVIEHPIAKHLLTCLRNVDTKPDQFRQLARSLSTILILEATKAVKTNSTKVQTPLEETTGLKIGQGLAVVPILRAGLGMLEPALDLFPDVAVGYIGLERNEKTAIAQSYYCKLPDLNGRYTLCFDPMLATGGSASQALSLLKGQGAKQLVMVSIIAAPEGVKKLKEQHKDVPIFVVEVDRALNEQRYIVPGLGDVGDRLYGTM
jgi:uracil phosphoribosyltransferase